MRDLTELKRTIKSQASRQARNSGTPYSDSEIDRELSRAGIARKPGDIPKQDESNADCAGSQVSAGAFIPTPSRTKKHYTLGTIKRPLMTFDVGHANIPKEEPSLADYWSLFKWRSMLNGATLLRPDLADAVSAYAHFLNGSGTDRVFSYERYVMNDTSGQITLHNAILDAQYAVVQLWKLNTQLIEFTFSGPAIQCDAKDPCLKNMFPYPATENWQKTIGAHWIWSSGRVYVKKYAWSRQPEFKMRFNLYAEDQYNFNPGDADMATKIRDSENGRFVIVGFARGFRHRATLSRSFSWQGERLGVAAMGIHTRLIR